MKKEQQFLPDFHNWPEVKACDLYKVFVDLAFMKEKQLTIKTIIEKSNGDILNFV